MNKISGGCLCGAVKYSADAEPVMVAICHCTHCQKQSGSAFSVNIGVPKGALQFSAGRPATYNDLGSSGQPVYRHFCAACGSPIYSDVQSTAGLDWLKAGTLDDSSWVKPAASIWCDSAQPWVSDPQGVARFPKSPPPG